MHPVVPALRRDRAPKLGSTARQMPMIVSPSAVTTASRGSTDRTSKAIGAELQTIFERQGWI